LRKIGAKNIEVGVGCGVGFGHGFGAGKFFNSMPMFHHFAFFCVYSCNC